MDDRNRIKVQLKNEALSYFKTRLQTEPNETDLVNTLILEAKWYCEKAAATSSDKKIEAAPTSLAAPPPSRPLPFDRPLVQAYLKDHRAREEAAELVYMKEQARQKARTEALLERAKQKEEFKKQAAQDREEYEYAIWKKRQAEKERVSYRGAKVYYPDTMGAPVQS